MNKSIKWRSKAQGDEYILLDHINTHRRRYENFQIHLGGRSKSVTFENAEQARKAQHLMNRLLKGDEQVPISRGQSFVEAVIEAEKRISQEEGSNE